MKTMSGFLSMVLLISGEACVAAAPGPTDGSSNDAGFGGSGGGSFASSAGGGEMTGGGSDQIEPFAERCSETGGDLVEKRCCITQGGWQPTCNAAPRCGDVLTCDAAGSAIAPMCECPEGSCFDPEVGCVRSSPR
jgi:hypothetical protein